MYITWGNTEYKKPVMKNECILGIAKNTYKDDVSLSNKGVSYG